MSEESITQARYERIGRFIVAFQRHADPEQLRAAAATAALAPDLAERTASLLRRYDEALEALEALQRNSLAGMPDTVSDDQLQAILADVQAFVEQSGWTHGEGRGR
ncbi:hypothetical protein ABIB38_002562 [Massilia sp. UYP11]|uniref:hypothetical protein n=1 Tax=Massilia sp. UYP11 TaxID=1756385 RepID=UPI003D1CC30A